MDSKILKNINENMKDLTFILTNRNYDRIGELNNVDINSFIYGHSTSGHEISFDVYKTVDGEDEILWDEIIDLKLLWVKELDVYFEIYISLNDTDPVKKTVTGTSLCEAELSQVLLFTTEINTDDDIARDDYEITTFYNFNNHNASLLHRILSKVPNYKIKHVDSSLSRIQRSFSIDGTSIYDFLTGECAEQFNCIFIFDSRDRSVSVYDLYAVCNEEECKHRSDIADFTHIDKYGGVKYTCPICGSTNVKYFGEDTGIFIDKENLTDSVQFTTDINAVKNCFKLIAGDDIITYTARLLNMNGTDYIYNITEEQKKDMPLELVEKIEQYDKLYDSYIEEYNKLIDEIYESSGKVYYYKHTMMPTVEHSPINSSTEAQKLTADNLSPLGLVSCTSNTSRATIESAIKNYAKVYAKTGYVKLEINESSFSYSGTDSNGNHYGYWTGNFKVTNYSDKEDVTYSDLITVKVYDNYEEFVNQKIKKAITNDDEDGSVFNVMSINDIETFKDALTHYGLARLESFYDAIQSALDCLVQLNQATEDSNLYNSVYLPYYNKLMVCQNEIDLRQSVIDEWENKYENAVLRQQEIQNELNFEKYIGEDLYKLFCCYRREDSYQNDNYISDGLEDQEFIKRAKEFIETAQKELVKSSTRQHSISSTLYDLLLIPAFKPLLEKFEIGNWLRVRADNGIYKLRLIKYEISFSDINKINVEFSDVTKINDSVSDTEDILNSAKSMATHYNYISKQAENGNNADSNINDWVKNGLNSALINIKNNNNEEISYGKHGLIAREYDDISDDYSDEQLRVTHNILAFTEDNWKTVSLGLGKHEYTYYDGNGFVKKQGYGISAKFCQAAYIFGSQIIGGDLYSANYSPTVGTHIDLNKGTFSFAGGNLSYDGATLSGKNLSVSASTITGTTMNSSNIYGTYINGGTIEGNTITGNEISGGTITGTSVYSTYINGGTIEGTYINGSVFETLSNGTNSATLKIQNAMIIASDENGNNLYSITPSSINLGDSAIKVSGFTNGANLINIAQLLSQGKITQEQAKLLYAMQESFKKKVDIMESLIITSDDITAKKRCYFNLTPIVTAHDNIPESFLARESWCNDKFATIKDLDALETKINNAYSAISNLASRISSLESKD